MTEIIPSGVGRQEQTGTEEQPGTFGGIGMQVGRRVDAELFLDR